MPLLQTTLTKDMTGATQILPFTRESQKAMAWCQSDEMGLWFIKKKDEVICVAFINNLPQYSIIANNIAYFLYVRSLFSMQPE